MAAVGKRRETALNLFLTHVHNEKAKAKQVLRTLLPGSDLEQKNASNQMPVEIAEFVGKDELAGIINKELAKMDRKFDNFTL